MDATVAVFGTEPGGGVSRLLTDLRIGHELLPTDELATADLDRYVAVVVLADDYPTPTRLDAGRLDAYVAAGHHAYVEYATAETFLPRTGEPEIAGYERIVHVESGALLEEHQSRYLPVEVPVGATVPLVYAKVAGVYSAVFGLPGHTAPALLHLPHGDGVLTYATTALSNFERGRYTLASRWEALWRDLLTGLLPDPPEYVPLEAWTVPRVWADPADPVRLAVATNPGVAVETSVPLTEKEPGRYESADLELAPGGHTFTVTAGDKTAEATISIQPRADRYRAMVDKAFVWFERAGMLFGAGDGSQGIAEGLSSELPPDGRHRRRDQLRGDCFVECAYAYRLYARLTGDHRYETIARTLMDLVLDRMQVTGRTYLHGSWDTRGYGKDKSPEELDYLFSDDEGWISLGALVFADGDDRALSQGLRGTEALLRTANEIGLQAEFQRREPVRLAKQGWKNVAALKVPDPIDVTPHWQSMPQTAYFYAYVRTGAQRYLDTATRGLDHMIARYPKIGVETSRTTAISRYLLPLAGAYEYTKDAKYKEILHELAGELEEWQDDETEAIREWDGFNPASNDAYGTTENSIFQTNGEPLADQLYSTGFLAMNLHVAYQATGEQRFRAIQERLLDFLARIQLESDDEQLDGAWMRSFDFQRWEYHGSSADIGWGPFCVETGWMVAPIVIGAISYLIDDRFFPEPRANETRANAIMAEFDALERELDHDGPAN